MPHRGASSTIFAESRRVIVRAVRSAFHALMMLAALFSTGVLPAAIASGSNEAESSQQEGSTSEHAMAPCEARARIRRLSSHRCSACVPAQHTPMAANASAQNSARAWSVPQLSLGLSLPLRR
jgi:hypothetical protein